MGKCCVAGAGDIQVNEKAKELRVKGKIFHQGDWISLDGTTGRVIEGKLKTLPAQPDDPDLVKFMSWVDPVRRLKVHANADIPATPNRHACSALRESASAAPSTCSLQKTASTLCAR
jgi:pyruvate, orthophosphate dikinase